MFCYQQFLLRYNFQLPNALEVSVADCKQGLKTLIHAELFVSTLKMERPCNNLSWFQEDLMFLLHLADHSQDTLTEEWLKFQARIFWLHCQWHYHNSRIDTALSYLDRVKECLENLKEICFCHQSVLYIRTIDSPEFVRLSHVLKLQETLRRSLRLEFVQDLYAEKKFKELVDILKLTFGSAESKSMIYRAPVDRPTQLRMFIDGLSHLEDFNEYLLWGEQSLDESLNQYLAAFQRKPEESVKCNVAVSAWAEIIHKIIIDIYEAIRLRRASLETLTRPCLARLAENLVRFCAHQLGKSEANLSLFIYFSFTQIMLVFICII